MAGSRIRPTKIGPTRKHLSAIGSGSPACVPYIGIFSGIRIQAGASAISFGPPLFTQATVRWPSMFIIVLMSATIP
jgi:hypothetical protein